MTDQLFLRRTIIAGKTCTDDYVVVWDGLEIGRIFKQVAVGGGDAWSWSCGLPNVPQASSHRGREPSLEAAKAMFRAAWTELHAQIGYREIMEARAIQADRSRPWHR